MSQNRYVVVPTVTVLAVMKARLVGAVKGHALLKKKADALTVRSALSPLLHAAVQLLPALDGFSC
jgi:vacuolar-type H+-ATPase subunit D/Vma8